jgi:monovalent cation/proton antiporter MnhG/PhaG subunit
MHHPIITSTLLAVAVAISILCAVGLLIARDPFAKLHYCTPVVSVGVTLIIIAVFLESTDVGARLKIVLIGIILFFMNAVLSHATARAMFIRKLGHWPPRPQDKIRISGRDTFAGESEAAE